MNETVTYEFLALVEQGGTWILAGQDRNATANDVAAYIHCTEDQRFNYMCRQCLDNRSYLMTLKSRGHAQRTIEVNGVMCMEITQIRGLVYPQGKGAATIPTAGA